MFNLYELLCAIGSSVTGKDYLWVCGGRGVGRGVCQLWYLSNAPSTVFAEVVGPCLLATALANAFIFIVVARHLP